MLECVEASNGHRPILPGGGRRGERRRVAAGDTAPGDRTGSLEELWIKSITITTGLVDTSSTPRLRRLIAEGRLDPLALATHRVKLGEIVERSAARGGGPVRHNRRR